MKQRKSNVEIIKLISDKMRESYELFSCHELSNNLNINWKTVSNFLKELEAIDAITKEDNKWRWGVVPTKFFTDYKEEKEAYIDALEFRLLQLKYNKKEGMAVELPPNPKG